MCRIPDGMKWSFSKLEAFHHCGMMFKLIYLDHAEKEGNGFSDYGTFCHKLLEEWAKGQIPDFALAEEYQERYDDEVVNAFVFKASALRPAFRATSIMSISRISIAST